MTLSANDRENLAEIEQGLRRADPELDRSLSSLTPAPSKRRLWTLLALAGCAGIVTVIGLAVHPLVSFIGFNMAVVTVSMLTKAYRVDNVIPVVRRWLGGGPEAPRRGG